MGGGRMVATATGYDNRVANQNVVLSDYNNRVAQQIADQQLAHLRMLQSLKSHSPYRNVYSSTPLPHREPRPSVARQHNCMSCGAPRGVYVAACDYCGREG